MQISEESLEMLRAAHERLRATQATYEFVNQMVFGRYKIPPDGVVNLATGAVSVPQKEEQDDSL